MFQWDAGFSSGDDDDEFSAHLLGANEEMVISYARRIGKPFITALGILLAKKSVNKSSLSVQHLNFADASVCGDDLKISLLTLGNFQKIILHINQN